MAQRNTLVCSILWLRTCSLLVAALFGCDDNRSPAEKRRAAVEQNLSDYDGSYAPLVKYIKDRMNDPDSFKHVETKYWDKGSSMYLLMTYRGKNVFGGVVTKSITCSCGLDADAHPTSLEILSESD